MVNFPCEYFIFYSQNSNKLIESYDTRSGFKRQTSQLYIGHLVQGGGNIQFISI